MYKFPPSPYKLTPSPVPVSSSYWLGAIVCSGRFSIFLSPRRRRARERRERATPSAGEVTRPPSPLSHLFLLLSGKFGGQSDLLFPSSAREGAQPLGRNGPWRQAFVSSSPTSPSLFHNPSPNSEHSMPHGTRTKARVTSSFLSCLDSAIRLIIICYRTHPPRPNYHHGKEKSNGRHCWVLQHILSMRRTAAELFERWRVAWW